MFFAFLGFYLLLNSSKLEYFFTGFFVGILWFYWIGFSFRFYELTWAIPFVIFGIAIICGVLFFIPTLITTFNLLRVFLLVLFSSFLPFFGFNWLNFGLLFYNTSFGLTFYHVLFFVSGVYALQILKKWKKLFSIVLFIFALDFSIKIPLKNLPFDVKIVSTQISQADKWEISAIKSTIDSNFYEIELAISERKRLIILPETAFPLYLNKEIYIQQILLKYSKDIAIITGALSHENNFSYNSAYFFDKGNMRRADKVVLVPFGESIPLPKFLAKPLSNLIFGSENNFVKADKVADFIVDGIKIRSAICYEGSKDELFVGDFSHMSVISNNSWFLPSTEPILQTLMLSLYATKNNKIIYHSVNGKGDGIIKPRETFLQKFIKNL